MHSFHFLLNSKDRHYPGLARLGLKTTEHVDRNVRLSINGAMAFSMSRVPDKKPANSGSSKIRVPSCDWMLEVGPSVNHVQVEAQKPNKQNKSE